MRLKDKAAIVTGAGRGIGRATALRFAQEGAKVVVADIDAASGQDTVSEVKTNGGDALFFQADVSQSEQVEELIEAAVKEYRTIDILVNNAIPGDVKAAESRWDPMVSVGLKGYWLCMQAVIPVMKKSGRGTIVNISSVNALMGFGDLHVYSGVKAGIIGLSRSLAGEVGKFGIRVNCICPGSVVTEAWRPYVERDPTLLDRLARFYPIGRLGRPEDVANAALFLASEEASFVTGAVLVIDGGVTAVNVGFADAFLSAPPSSGAH